jgi:DNA-binding GntR family transcriptional regulator
MVATEGRFNAIKNESLRSKVVETLKNAIYSGRLHPGEALPELRVASELDVSQATVREALTQLEALGLVERSKSRRVRVTKFSKEEMTERVRIRILLEGMAFTEAAARMTAEHYAGLEKRLAAFHSASASNDMFARVRTDFDIHHYVWEVSGNRTLIRMLVQLTSPLFAYASILRAQGMVRSPVVVNPHEAFVDALRSSDVRVITETVRQHVAPSFESFLKGNQQV